MVADAEGKESSGSNPDSQGVCCRITKVRRDTVGRLVAHLEDGDQPVEDVRIARCFPWTLPDTYISVRDKEGKEIALMKTLDELDSDSRKVVEEELRDKVFNPRIRRVLDYAHEFGVTSIEVETDRGVVTFQIRSRDDVRVLSATRALFRDADGNTYELADLTTLDPTSQKCFQDYF